MAPRSITCTVALCAGIAAGLLSLPAAAQASQGPAQSGGGFTPTQAVTDAITSLEQQIPGVGVLREGSQIARVYGKTLATGASPAESARNFLRQHAAIFGVRAADMAAIGPFDDGAHLVQLMPDRSTGIDKFTGVYFTQKVGDVPVFRGHLCVLVRNQANFPAVLASSTLWDTTAMESLVAGKDLTSLPHPSVYTRHALNSFAAQPTVTPAQYVIWAGVDRQHAEPRLAVMFEAEGGGVWAPAEHQRIQFVVDAETGDILYQESRIYHAQGQVRGLATVDSVADVCAAEVATGLPYARIQVTTGSGTTTVYADSVGNYTLPPVGDASVTFTIGGQYFTMSDVLGPALSETVNLSDSSEYSPLFNGANSAEAHRAQVNAYLHSNIVRDRVLQASPSYPAIATQVNFPITVNIADTCNAYYLNNSINFFRSGGGCNNSAFGSVVHHEFGHHVVAKGGSGQGPYGEGMGDVCAIIVTDSSDLGFGFYNCDGPLRDADNNCQYQVSGCSSCGSASHACGRLLSGCVWDLRNEFIVDYPGDYLERVAELAINSVLLHGAVSTITPAITLDFLTLDDDDGDVLNGTPNYARIAAAFNAHGMTAPALLPVKFTYPDGRPETAAPNGTTTVRVNVEPLSGAPLAGSAKAFVKAPGAGTFAEVPLAALGAHAYQFTIPAGPCGGEPQYYFTAQSTGGVTVASPSAAPATAWRTILATELSIALTDEFETDSGWTVGAAGDNATSGLWVRADPVGTLAQPEDDHTPSLGTHCWVTGNAAPGAGDGTNDVDSGVTTLVSPAYDLSGHDAVYVSYWLWYSNNLGAEPNADTMPVQVSNNNGASWVNMEVVSQSATAWVHRQFLVNDFVPLTSQVRFRFRAADLAGGSLVEAALDDFKLTAAACATAIPGDLNGDGSVGGADLGMLLAGWGTAAGDINGDGTTDGADLGILLSNWG